MIVPLLISEIRNDAVRLWMGSLVTHNALASPLTGGFFRYTTRNRSCPCAPFSNSAMSLGRPHIIRSVAISATTSAVIPIPSEAHWNSTGTPSFYTHHLPPSLAVSGLFGLNRVTSTTPCRRDRAPGRGGCQRELCRVSIKQVQGYRHGALRPELVELILFGMLP